jgi:hypothetical protein
VEACVGPLVRFGKPAAPLLRHKASFIRENDDLLAVQMRQAALYRSQPPRERCMTCAAPIGGVTFVKLGVGFSLCNRCSHLNGMHADTDAFCDAIYSADAGEAYAINYAEPDKAAYDARVRDIYTPKIDFLFDALRDRGEAPGLGICSLRSRLPARGIAKGTSSRKPRSL